MKKFILSTDSVSDLSDDYVMSNHIDVHALGYSLDNVQYAYGDIKQDRNEFYMAMKQNKQLTTHASNPYSIELQMRQQVLKGNAILHISFSSALSSSFNNALFCANKIMDEVEGSSIVVVDSLNASAGLGLLVNEAVIMKNAGKSMDQIHKEIESLKSRVKTQFIVDDLFHLMKGGRLSKTKAYIGSTLNIKPILEVDSRGQLTALKNIRGHKKARRELLENMSKTMDYEKTHTVYISHADSLNDAVHISDSIGLSTDINTFVVNDISPTLAAHTGPKALVIAYIISSV